MNRGAVAHHRLARAASAAPSRAHARIRRERVNAGPEPKNKVFGIIDEILHPKGEKEGCTNGNFTCQSTSKRSSRCYYGRVSASVKADLTIVTEADAAVENYLKLALRGLAPGYGYIGEETAESRAPAAGETHSWIVDAFDGSRAFAARLPMWSPAVCLLRGDRPLAGAAFNPLTRELFWAAEETPAFCNDEPLRPHYETVAKANTIVLGSTDHHRTFKVDFPGRIYCLGAPIYQLCLVAKGAAQAFFFGPYAQFVGSSPAFTVARESGGKACLRQRPPGNDR